MKFVVGSRPCSKGFSPGFLVFLPPQKPTLPNSNLTQNAWTPLKQVPRVFFGALRGKVQCKHLSSLYMYAFKLTMVWVQYFVLMGLCCMMGQRNIC